MKPYTIDDAEQELRVAIDTDDTPTITRLEPVIDHLEHTSRRPAPTLHAAALWYAEHGIHVFPLQVGRKAPLAKCDRCKARGCPGPQECAHELCHGLLDATTDLDLVNTWWTTEPRRNIGIATGHEYDVVDIDGLTGQQSRTQHWDTTFGQIDTDALAKVLTPRPGGMHIWVPPTGDGNAAGIVPGVDYRGVGGYVLTPPSVIFPGGKDAAGTYRFLGTPNIASHPAGAVA